MKTIDKNICSKILTIGCAFDKPKGGIAQVLHTYQNIYIPFNFIATTTAGNTVKNACTLLAALVKYLYFLLCRDIQIIHIHGASYNSFYRKRIFIYIGKLFHKSVIYHIHGGGFKTFTSQHPNIVKATLAKCNLAIALSDTWRNFFINECDCKNVCVIPNIIAFPIINHTMKKDNRLNLLFLGKVCKEKGIFDLLESIRKYSEPFQGNVRILIGGNGDTDRLEKLIKEYKLENIVTFCGWVNGQQKIELLNKADVYILPSYNEGLPISILEAMSYGMPIISTPVGGIPEIVSEENGFLVQPGDIDAIAESIGYFIKNPYACKRMGEESKKKARVHLPDAVSHSLEKLYVSLLNTKI